MRKTIVLSGGFDPLHIGHIKMFQDADQRGYNITLILNTDGWLIRKKGFYFQTFEDRKVILESCRYIDLVVESIDHGDTVIDTLSTITVDVFGNGGDRKQHNTPEDYYCETAGIDLIYGLGGEDKPNSSSLLVKRDPNFNSGNIQLQKG